MQRKTALKVANLLGAVETTLRAGRPRKRPGRSRPTSADGLYSLVGAMKADAKLLGYGWLVRERAAEVILDATPTMVGTPAHTLGVLDRDENDTRQIIRYVRAARRRIELQLSTETRSIY